MKLCKPWCLSSPLSRRVLRQLAQLGIRSSASNHPSLFSPPRLSPSQLDSLEAAYLAANATIRLASYAYPLALSRPITVNRWIIDTSLGQ